MDRSFRLKILVLLAVAAGIALSGCELMAGPTTTTTTTTTTLPNLLSNGGFESGMEGWTTWHASWASEEAMTASSSPEAAKDGSAGLAMATVGQNSCGVYQEFPTILGRYYTVDGWWRSTASENGWFEVVMFPGSFDLTKADSPAEVFKHVLAGWDSGFRDAAGTLVPAPPPESFDWQAFLDSMANAPQNKTGKVRATGSKMTIVLKLGGTSRAVDFDSVRVYETP
jgi:hypothetical protein